MTRDWAEFLCTLVRQGVPLEPESIEMLVNHALKTTKREPEPPDLTPEQPDAASSPK